MIAKSCLCSSVVLAAISVMSWRLATAGEGESKPNAALPPGTLSGKVVDPDGKPVAVRRVWVETWDDKMQDSKLLADARSGPDGRFRLGPVEPIYRHPFPILIEAEGYARQYSHLSMKGSYSIFPGADFDLGEIRLARGRVFAGQVIDADGKPLRDGDVIAEIYVRELGHTVGDLGPDYHCATDSDGRYRTPPLPVGDLSVSIQSPNRKLAYVGCPVAPGGEQVLKTLHLECDVPIAGVVSDELGNPIARASIYAAGHQLTSGMDGKFTIHGFGPKPRFQLNVSKDGYVPILWGVKVEDDGIHWDSGRDANSKGMLKQLAVTLVPAAWIEARAIDAETGKPVHVDKVVRCFFERKPSGEAVLSGCWSPAFEQPETGLIRIPYQAASEYHLTVSAAGYHDGEAFTPKVTRLQPIVGIEIKLKKNAPWDKPRPANADHFRRCDPSRETRDARLDRINPTPP